MTLLNDYSIIQFPAVDKLFKYEQKLMTEHSSQNILILPGNII
jgi:hypothetical protein